MTFVWNEKTKATVPIWATIDKISERLEVPSILSHLVQNELIFKYDDVVMCVNDREKMMEFLHNRLEASDVFSYFQQRSDADIHKLQYDSFFWIEGFDACLGSSKASNVKNVFMYFKKWKKCFSYMCLLFLDAWRTQKGAIFFSRSPHWKFWVSTFEEKYRNFAKCLKK